MFLGRQKRFGSSRVNHAAARMRQTCPIRRAIRAVMARNPYAARRDFTWLKRGALGVGIALVAALLAFNFLRPAQTAEDLETSAAAVAQMDAAEAQSDEKREAAERERQALY